MKIKHLIFLFLFSSIFCWPQENEIHCGTSYSSSSQDSIRHGGKFITSTGELNVLIIFAQFPDDNFEPNNKLWPAGKNPTDMNKWVEKTWTSNPVRGSLTHYFNDMSFNKLKITGKAISVISPHTRQWYLNNNQNRGDIHLEILQQIDSTMDFSPFDNWTPLPNLNHINKPDGIIDMVIFIWRNISQELPDKQTVDNRMDFEHDYGSIGCRNFKVDNGQRIIWGVIFGSGVTIRNYLPDRNKAFGVVVHEFAHYFFGGNEFHSGFGFWGMLSSWGVRSIVANSFERSKLGWINLKYIPPDSVKTYKDMKLEDYVTTGQAYCLEIAPSLGQYFYLENHQCISYWETEFKFGNIEKGLYVLRKDKIYPSTENDSPCSAYLKLISAEGRFEWVVNSLTKNPWGNDNSKLPVFKKLRPDRANGFHPLEFIPWSLNGKIENPSPIFFTEDELGNAVLDVKYQGHGKDAFDIGYNEVFTPWSNPNSYNFYRDPTVFGFKLNNLTDGVYSLDIFVSTSIEAPPSKPVGLNLIVDSVGRSVKLTWQKNIEPDFSYYEISRKINGEDDLWNVIGYTKDTSFADSTIYNLRPGESLITYYRIRVKDSQNLYSVYSDIKSISLKQSYKLTNVIKSSNNIQYELYQNYPNPFNPSTSIQYAVGSRQFVTLKIYDILGREIAILVDEEKPAGTYKVTWNAVNIPSGVYFYQLKATPVGKQAGSYIKSKKMLLLK